MTDDLDEQDDDGDDEGVDRDRLGERGADDHRRPDRALGLGVAPERLHRAPNREADAEPRADSTDADRDRRPDVPYGIDVLDSCEHPAPPPPRATGGRAS